MVKCNEDGSDCDWRWNKANVQSVGGGIVVPNGTPLRFYVGARTGVDQLVGNGTAGFAELRRDVRLAELLLISRRPPSGTAFCRCAQLAAHIYLRVALCPVGCFIGFCLHRAESTSGASGCAADETAGVLWKGNNTNSVHQRCRC